jgi:hypothetical protein
MGTKRARKLFSHPLRSAKRHPFFAPHGGGEAVKSALVTQEKEQTFLHCKCPKCKRAFDFVPISAYECPFCQWEIRRDAVWQTRQYPGVIMLPGWVKAFGWPFLLMLSGVAFFLWCYFTVDGMGTNAVIVSSIIVGTGLIFFIAKLNTNGEA